jgi:Glycosyl transferase family 2
VRSLASLSRDLQGALALESRRLGAVQALHQPVLAVEDLERPGRWHVESAANSSSCNAPGGRRHRERELGHVSPPRIGGPEEQTRRPKRTVVVDNASVDGSAENLEQVVRDLELIRLDENVGFAAANNVVIREAADADWLALLNPDAFPERRWLEELLHAAALPHRNFVWTYAKNMPAPLAWIYLPQHVLVNV